MVDVSVIVPFYNTEKYIGRCLKSIASQKGVDADVILIDNGSTECPFLKKILIRDQMHLWKFLDGCRVRSNVLTIVNYFIDNHHRDNY